MKKNDTYILLLAILLLCAMIITFLIGGENSRHGVGLTNEQALSMFLLKLG